MTSQRIGKYACLETERRYLLSKIPDDLLDKPEGWFITDRYFANTRLRLRHMKSVSEDEHIYKLTQKYRAESQNPIETTITNIYLTKQEYDFLEFLGGKMVKKTRYPYRAQNHKFSIDVFEGRHKGLILAELELDGQSGLAEDTLPWFALKEVTDDPFFTGGQLAMMTEQEFSLGLAKRLRDENSY